MTPNMTMERAPDLVAFDWLEYSVFGAVLALSTAISLYHGLKSGAGTVSSYVLGDKRMNVFPVTMSLIASHVSSVTVIGVPSEVYMYGTQYYTVIISGVIVTIINTCFFIPVFYKLQLTSLYEYLELRFSHGVRVFGSSIFSLYLLFYIPVVLYVPALALNQVTGLPVHSVTPVISIVCILYTSYGGLRGVSWTIALQSVFTTISLITVIVLGCLKVGSIHDVFKYSNEGHRLELFNMNLDPFARNTFWTMTVGTTVNWLAQLCFHPGVVQRFMSVPSHIHAVRVMVWSGVGICVIKTVTVFLGLVMFSYYSSCDPLATGEVQRPGQLLPLFVKDIAGSHFHGLTGLFIAGVFSATLSTMAASLNTVAGTVYEDFIQPFCKTDRHAPLILRLIVLVLGSLCLGLVFVVEHLGGVLQVAVSLGGVANGTLLTLFLLGLLSPWTNTKGAVAGSLTSFLVSLWIVGGSQWNIAQGRISFPGKVTSVVGCQEFPLSTNLSLAESRVSRYTGLGSPVLVENEVAPLFTLSYMYYATVGAIAGFSVAALVTAVTCQDLSKLNPDLLVPIMRRFLPPRPTPELPMGDVVDKN
ncbi:sodium-coupled monocarboxylate transporter 2-like isoform X2 [Homalodisca vitripennis]|nr:sodium-coupled monocarboxylate transporter 2-like isoform X2 [Homalodisca vitripennis]